MKKSKKIFDKMVVFLLTLAVISYLLNPLMSILLELQLFVFNGLPPTEWLNAKNYNFDIEDSQLNSLNKGIPRPNPTISVVQSISPTNSAQQKEQKVREKYIDKMYYPSHPSLQTHDALFVVDRFPRGNAETTYLLVNDRIINVMRLYNLKASTSAELRLPPANFKTYFNREVVIDGTGNNVLFVQPDEEKCINILRLLRIDTHTIKDITSIKYDPNYNSNGPCYQIDIAISHIAISPNGKYGIYWVAKNITTGAGFKADMYFANLETNEVQLLFDSKFLHDGPKLITAAAKTVWIDENTISFLGYAGGSYTGEWSYNIKTKDLKKIKDLE